MNALPINLWVVGASSGPSTGGSSSSTPANRKANLQVDQVGSTASSTREAIPAGWRLHDKKTRMKNGGRYGWMKPEVKLVNTEPHKPAMSLHFAWILAFLKSLPFKLHSARTFDTDFTLLGLLCAFPEVAMDLYRAGKKLC